MHINMKYYIVTIGAIFISLGIGILVGFNLNYDQELSKQQAQVINNLDDKFEGLKATNDKLEDSLANLGKEYDNAVEFINQNIDKIIVDELQTKSIGIISTNENNDSTKEIGDTISKASGNIAFNIVLKSSINDKNKLNEISEKINEDIKTNNDVINYIVESLKTEDASTKLAYLEELGVIKVNSLGTDYLQYESVVISGGYDGKDAQDQFDKIDKILVSKLKEENKYLVGVQSSDQETSYVDLYSKNKVATVDNIEEGVGQLSLVLLLKNSSGVGNFGRLENAESLLPYKK